MIPEFHRPRAQASLAPAGETVAIAARGAERAALARRFDLPAIRHLAARFHLLPDIDGGVLAKARLVARFTQICVVTLTPFPATIAAPFMLRFVPAGRESEGDDPEAIDTVGVTAGMLDLGEAAAEQFALLLDPYPRLPGASLRADYAPRPNADAQTANGALPFATLAARLHSRRGR